MTCQLSKHISCLIYKRKNMPKLLFPWLTYPPIKMGVDLKSSECFLSPPVLTWEKLRGNGRLPKHDDLPLLILLQKGFDIGLNFLSTVQLGCYNMKNFLHGRRSRKKSHSRDSLGFSQGGTREMDTLRARIIRLVGSFHESLISCCPAKAIAPRSYSRLAARLLHQTSNGEKKLSFVWSPLMTNERIETHGF